MTACPDTGGVGRRSEEGRECETVGLTNSPGGSGRPPAGWRCGGQAEQPITAALLLLAAGVALAAAGDLDGSFNQTGKFVTEFGAPFTDAAANAVVLQPDGKLVVALQRAVENVPSFALMRLRADGRLDDTFSPGIVPIALGHPGEAAAVALQPDGKIVAAGTVFDGTDRRFVVVRVHPTGIPDATFSGDGIATTDFGVGDSQYASAVAVQRDGRILVAGSAGDEFALARFNPDGSPDATFDRDGRVTTGVPNGGRDPGRCGPAGRQNPRGRWRLFRRGRPSDGALSEERPPGPLLRPRRQGEHRLRRHGGGERAGAAA